MKTQHAIPTRLSRVLASIMATLLGAAVLALPNVALASTLTVNTVADHVNDGCALLATGDCTLRRVFREPTRAA